MNLPKGYMNQTIEQALYPKLSPQELEIVKLYAMGLSIKEIANQTFLEPMGLDTHIQQIETTTGQTLRTIQLKILNTLNYWGTR